METEIMRKLSDNIDIGKKIRSVWEQSGMTVTAFAKKINQSTQNVYNIFGKSSINTDQLKDISIVLNHNFFQYYQPKKEPEVAKKKYRVTIQVHVDNEEEDKILRLIGINNIK